MSVKGHICEQDHSAPFMRPGSCTGVAFMLFTQENAQQRNSLESPAHKLSGRPRVSYSFDETIELVLKLAADPRKVRHWLADF